MAFVDIFDLLLERTGNTYLAHFRLSDSFKAAMGDGVTSYQLSFNYDLSSVSDLAVSNAALVNIGNLKPGRLEFGGYGIDPFNPGDGNSQLLTLGFTTDAASIAIENLSIEIWDANWNETYQQFTTPLVLDLLVAPTITSPSSASIDEGGESGNAILTITASDDLSGLSFSLKSGLEDDAASFEIDSETGVVTFKETFDYETKSIYSFTAVVTDSDGLVSEKEVTLNINNLDEVAPEITSSKTATALDENSPLETVIYTATATDDADVSGGVTFAIKTENDDDGGMVSIDSATGIVKLVEAADYETKSSYSFTIIATDAAGNASEKAVTLSINNLDEVAPTFTSDTNAAVAENVGENTVVYTAVATDDKDISEGFTFSLKQSDADDSDLLTIDEVTGEVVLASDPDYETKSLYGFTLVVTDTAGLRSEQEITLNVTNQDESAPTFGVESVETSVDEESGTNQVIHTAVATDSADISSGITYSLKANNSDNADQFSIDAATGVVSLLIDPDYETQSAYTFTVVATDGAGFTAEQAVKLMVNDIAEIPSVYAWHTHQLFDSVTKTQDGSVSVPMTEFELGRVISAADALATLKMAVGLNPNSLDAVTGEPASLSPFQLLAADVNKDGRVSAADALNVLKMAVNLESAPAREWILVSEDIPLWDIENDTALITRSSVDWETINKATASAAGTTKLVAILKGDANASWQGSDNMETLDDDYFTGDTFKGVGSPEQWWVI